MIEPRIPRRRGPRRRAGRLGRTVAVVATLAQLACGGEHEAAPDTAGGASASRSTAPSADRDGSRADPCALLSPEEVGEALGTTVSEPTRREAGDGESRVTICIYDGGWPNTVNLTVRQSARSGDAGTSGSLAAELNADLDEMAADTSMADLVEGGRWDPLPLNDHAAAVRDAGEGGWTVVIRERGGRSVEALVNAPSREAAVGLASTVAKRLDAAG